MLGIYQLYVTVRVSAAAQYSLGQKVVQVAMIWLVPFIGSVVCHAFLASDTRFAKKQDRAFITDGGDSPHGAGSEGVHH